MTSHCRLHRIPALMHQDSDLAPGPVSTWCATRGYLWEKQAQGEHVDLTWFQSKARQRSFEYAVFWSRGNQTGVKWSAGTLRRRPLCWQSSSDSWRLWHPAAFSTSSSSSWSFNTPIQNSSYWHYFSLQAALFKRCLYVKSSGSFQSGWASVDVWRSGCGTVRRGVYIAAQWGKSLIVCDQPSPWPQHPGFPLCHFTIRLQHTASLVFRSQTSPGARLPWRASPIILIFPTNWGEWLWRERSFSSTDIFTHCIDHTLVFMWWRTVLRIYLWAHSHSGRLKLDFWASAVSISVWTACPVLTDYPYDVFLFKELHYVRFLSARWEAGMSVSLLLRGRTHS